MKSIEIVRENARLVIASSVAVGRTATDLDLVADERRIRRSESSVQMSKIVEARYNRSRERRLKMYTSAELPEIRTLVFRFYHFTLDTDDVLVVSLNIWNLIGS